MSEPVTNANLNQQKQNPNLSDVLNLWKKDIFLNFNCHAIGTIQSFDKATQTARATINYTKTFFKPAEPPSKGFVPYYVDYPLLAQCPVLILGGGDASVTMPIAAGDQCMIFFNDRSIDDWYRSGIKTNLSLSVMHSISDAIIFVGLHSMKNPIANYDDVRAVMRNGTAALGANKTANKVLITNTYPANSATLNTILQNLVLAIKTITTSNAVVGAPCTISVASQAALTAIALQIGGLLE